MYAYKLQALQQQCLQKLAGSDMLVLVCTTQRLVLYGKDALTLLPLLNICALPDCLYIFGDFFEFYAKLAKISCTHVRAVPSMQSCFVLAQFPHSQGERST